MATATQVTIRVVVDGQQAGPAIDGINQKLDEIGVKGTASLRQAGQAADQMGGHVATSLDSVRLLSQEFGMRMPRAIEAMLSRMPAVTGALSSMLSVMAGVAAVEIFTRVITGAVEAYDKFFSLNSVIEKYNDNMEKARLADLPNTRDIETTRQRLITETHTGFASGADAQAQKDAGFKTLAGPTWTKMLLGPAGAIPDAISGGIQMYGARKTQEQASQADEARNALERKRIEDAHELTLQQIDLNHAQDATLTGAQKINAEALKAKAIAGENRRFGVSMDKTYGNEVSPQAGLEQERMKDQQADAAAAAARTNLGREEALAIMKADDAAAQARLQGEDLYRLKMQDDIRETTAELVNQGKAAEIPSKVREINEKYFADLSERFVKSQSESGLATSRANSAGLTGAARIEADRWSTVSENNTKFAGDPDRLHSANEAAATDSNNKLTELQQQFSERMQSIEEGRVSAILGGYARIEAEAAKTAHQIQDDFNKSWGGADQSSPQFIAAKKAEQDALTAVQQDAGTQRAEYQQKQDQETLRYDEQAAAAERRVKNAGLAGWVGDYQNTLAEIRAKEAEQTQALNDELAKRDIDEQAYARRKADVEHEADAEAAAASQAMTRQIASTLQEAFDNPLDFIKRKMQQVFFEIAADAIMRLGPVQRMMNSLGGGGSSSFGGRMLGAFGLGSAHPAAGGGTGAGAASAGAGLSSGSAASAPGYGSAASSGAGYASGGYTSSGGDTYRPAYTSASGGGAAGTIQSSIGSGESLYNTISGARSQMAIAGAASPAASSGGQNADLAAAAAVPASASGIPDDGTADATATADASGAIEPTSTPSTGNIPMQSMPTYNAPAQQQTSGAARTAQAGLAIAGAGMAGYAGYEDAKADFKSGSATGTMKGMLGDAMAGAAIGSLFGPVGTLVGAGVGAAVGLVAGVTGAIMGEGGRIAARDYYKKTLFPELESERNGAGSSDYQMAISNVNRIASDGMVYMAKKWGTSAAQWVDDNYLKKEQQLADAELTARAKGGSQYVSMSAVQFHTGGLVSGFGDLATSSTEGYIHAMMGEGVLNPSAMAMHGPAVGAMNSGASPADMARMYLAGSGSAGAGAGGGVTHNHQWSVSTMDSKSFDDFLGSGTNARTMVKHVNSYASQYAGDGISG